MFQSQTGSQALSDRAYRKAQHTVHALFQSQTGSQALSDGTALQGKIWQDGSFNPKREVRPSQTRDSGPARPTPENRFNPKREVRPSQTEQGQHGNSGA